MQSKPTYSISIDMQPTEIDKQNLHKAKETNHETNTSTTKYIESSKFGSIMKYLLPEQSDLNFVRTATKLFQADKITIQR